MGKAPITTDAIAATKRAKRCHAWGTRPTGTGENHRPKASARTAPRARCILRSAPAKAAVTVEPPPGARAP